MGHCTGNLGHTLLLLVLALNKLMLTYAIAVLVADCIMWTLSLSIMSTDHSGQILSLQRFSAIIFMMDNLKEAIMLYYLSTSLTCDRQHVNIQKLIAVLYHDIA